MTATEHKEDLDPDLFRLLHIRDSLKLLTEQVSARKCMTLECHQINETIKEVNATISGKF